MHAEIAAAVAREHTPGLSIEAAARLEELLGRSASVLELEVYAALLRGAGVARGGGWLLRVALEAAAALTGTGGREAASAAAEVMAQAVGLVAAPAGMPRALVAGDALLYLGAATGREGLGGSTAEDFGASPKETAPVQTLELLRSLLLPPGLLLHAQVLGRGGLAQAAVGLGLGCQLLLDAVPRQPVVLHPKELLLAETPSRALVVVAAERADEVLRAAQAQGVAAAALGVMTATDRLSVLMKPRGAKTARPVCELPLQALHQEPAAPRVAAPRAEEATTSPPPAPGAVLRHFPRLGFLIAVLGFEQADAAQEHAAGALCNELIGSELCTTVQAIGQGGLLLALWRACAPAEVGCTAVLPVAAAGSADTGVDVLLREAPGRYLLAIPAHRQADARLLASDRGVPLGPLGRTGGSELLIRRSDGPEASPFIEVLRLPVALLAAALPRD